MTDPIVYAIASGKGGVGKTTLAINLGAALAARDRSVVVVDVDVGMANMATFLGLEIDGPTLHDVLAGAVAVHEATYEAPGDFAIVPGGSSLDGFGDVDMRTLADAVEALRDAFDLVLLDVGGGLSHDTAMPLGLADRVLLVTTADLASLENVWTTKDLAERLECDIEGIVVTRTGSQFDLGIDVIESELAERVLAVVPEDDAIRASVEAGTPVVLSHPDSPVAEGVDGLAGILLGEDDVSIPVVPRGHGSDLGETDADPIPAGPAGPPSPVGDDGPAGTGEPDSTPSFDRGTGDESGSAEDSVTGVDADPAVAETEADSDDGGETEAGVADESPSDADADTDASSDGNPAATAVDPEESGEPDTDTESDSDTDTESDSDSESDTDTESDSDTESDTDTEADTDTEPDSESDSGADTGGSGGIRGFIGRLFGR